MTRFLFCASIALLGAGTSVSAYAAESQIAVKSVNVAYGDLDLSRDEGARTLIRRLTVAAGTACGPAPDIRALSDSEHYKACQVAALDQAVKSVPASRVAAIYGHQDSNAPASIVVAGR